MGKVVLNYHPTVLLLVKEDDNHFFYNLQMLSNILRTRYTPYPHRSKPQNGKNTAKKISSTSVKQYYPYD